MGYSCDIPNNKDNVLNNKDNVWIYYFKIAKLWYTIIKLSSALGSRNGGSIERK